MPDKESPTHLSTQAISSQDEVPGSGFGDAVMPIHLASTYEQDRMGDNSGYTYTRSGNPTRTALEQRLAAIEDGEDALALASGMGAIGTTMMTLLEPGDHVVAFNYLYGGTRKLFDELYVPSLNIDVDYVDATSTSEVADAIRPDTKLVYVESPTNPLLKLCDIEAIAPIASDADATFCVDNTFATPCFQNPLELGADIVVHSTTKYINGHSDSLGGAIVTNDKAIAEDLQFVQKYGTGSVLSPFDAYLVLRGLKTLHARMERHETNATAVAEFLEDHPKIDAVHYPGVESHSQHTLATKQMDGYGGMLSFEIAGGESAAAVLLENLEYVKLAVSLGGVESMAAHVPTMTHYYLTDDTRKAMGISDSLIRMSVGIEGTQDILADLAQGLEQV